jgi:ATP-binding cassette subfamily F protein 3
VLGAGGGNGENRAAKDEARQSRAELRRAAAERRTELAPLKRRIDAFDKTITSLTKRLAEIDAMLADPRLYDRDPAKVATLGKERADAASAPASAEDQWLALSGEYEDTVGESERARRFVSIRRVVQIPISVVEFAVKGRKQHGSS